MQKSEGKYALTEPGESKLSASYLSIGSAPEVVTHRTPGLVVANFHTSLEISLSVPG